MHNLICNLHGQGHSGGGRCSDMDELDGGMREWWTLR